MGVVLNWNSGYPSGGIDNTTINFPTLTDNVHDVLASHVNSLASAVIALQNGVGPAGGLRVREADSTPSILPVHTLVFPNGSVTDLGTGTVSVSVAGTSGFQKSVVASDFGTPDVILGSISDITISDIAPGAYQVSGIPRNIILIEIEDPASNTAIVLPINSEAIPQRWKLEFSLIGGAPPSSDFFYGPFIKDTDGDGVISIVNTAENSATSRPITIVGAPEGGSPTVSWSTASSVYDNFIEGEWYFDSIQPFNVTYPQLSMDLHILGQAQTSMNRFLGPFPSSGDMAVGFPGLSLTKTGLSFFFPNAITGSVIVAVYLDFVKHPRDY